MARNISPRRALVRGLRMMLTAAVLAAPSVTAQASAFDPLLPVCPAGMSPRVDTTQVIVVLEPARAFLDSAYTDAQRQQIAFFADGITRHFVPPASLGDVPTLVDLPAYYREGSDDGSRSVLTGRLVLIIRRDGKLKNLAWEYVPLARPLAVAVVQAAQAADSAGDFDGIMRPDEKAPEDTLAIDIRSRLEGQPAQFPLMRARLPGYRGETLATVVQWGRLEYPRTAWQQHVATKGEVRFVVGTDGRAVPELIQVTRAGWRDFVMPMRKSIAQTSFTPATSGGCKVPALARQRFDFSIPR